MLHITLDASPAVHRRAGIGRYVQELTLALLEIAPQYKLTGFYNHSSQAILTPPFDDLTCSAIPTADKPWRLRVLLAHFLRRPQNALFSVTDLFHATDHLLPYLLHIPSVFTLHDLTHRLYPHTQTTLNQLYLSLMIGRFLYTASAVITNSESTRRDAILFYNLDPEKIRAIPLGVHARFRPANSSDILAIRKTYRLPERFLLYVGTIEPRKNLNVILEAIQGDDSLRLVAAGKQGWLAQEFYRRIKDYGLQKRVTLLGTIPEEDLPALYSAARAFVFPSLYEGFGLPPLEAMACGVPVICSNTSSLPEVVHDAAILIPPTDARALGEAITRLWSDDALRGELHGRGLRQAAHFTWERTARATLTVYQELIGYDDASRQVLKT